MMVDDFFSLDKIQHIVKDCLKKPEAYLSIQDHVSQSLKNSTKYLYDLAVKTKLLKNCKSEALSKLIIDDFDSEQIWQQLEIENNEEFSRLSLGKISKTLANKNFLILPLKTSKDDDSKKIESFSEDEHMQEDFELEESVSDVMLENEENKTKTNFNKKRKRTTEVDDKFFKLDELDEYLKQEDKKELKLNKKKYNDSDEETESIDLFNNLSELDDEEDQGDEIKNGRSLKYADFFDSPESCDEGNEENENINGDEDDNNDDNNKDVYNNSFCEIKTQNKNNANEIQENKKDKKKVKFNFPNNSDDESDSIENDTTEDVEDKDKIKTVKSSLEARQDRLKKRIKELEEEAVSEKPWQLKGETSASKRPQNSLLEEYVEFDTVSRPAPIMTEQTTMKLEDIIRGRIKDKAWDDVEKKVKLAETPMEYKKKLIMNQEKSKESLAQIYENEYIKQREALTSEDKDEQEKQEPPEHIEITECMHSLFKKLDALCNFHYTPKPAKPEIQIISNVPAVNMEEVAPIATTEATLLAPEEVQSKQKGELIGKSERTKTDMKRERRNKKLKQHLRAVNQSKKQTDGIKQKKSLKKAVASGKLKGRNIINADDTTNNKDGKTIKSSTAFFAQLQDQVVNTIKAKTSTTTNKKNKKEMSAIKLKL